MAASVDSILKYLPRLLPEIKVYPLPEDIFLSTIKALVVPAASLSLSQWGIVGSLILLTNISPTLRKATAKLYGYLSLIIGAEIALINAYVLVSILSFLHLGSLTPSPKVCSWISPSTTLQPLTVAILNVLNSLVPVYTDSLVLFYLVMEKASHSDSKINLVSSMGTPILLKFMRLAHAVMYIHTSTEFILTSFAIAKDGANPNTSIVDMARMWNVYISSSLQLVDNLSVLCIVCDTSSFTSLLAGIRSTCTGPIRLRCGSPSTHPVRSRFHAYTRVMLICWSFFFYQQCSPRRASLASSGPSVHSISSRSSSTPRSSPCHPTFRPAIPRCSSTRPKS
jgi:hypothetical protein